MTTLRSLAVRGTGIGNRGVEHIAYISNLTRLSLEQCGQLTDACIPAVAKLRELSALDLGHTNIGDSGLESLVALPKLTSLTVRSTRVTDVGLAHLQAMKSLTFLDLSNTKVTPAGVAALQKALPNCKIIHESLSASDDPDREAP